MPLVTRRKRPSSSEARRKVLLARLVPLGLKERAAPRAVVRGLERIYLIGIAILGGEGRKAEQEH